VKRTSGTLLILLCIVAGSLPLLVYGIEHGGLGAPAFSDFQAMSAGEQFAQAAAGLFVKPIYMILSLALIIGLWEQSAPPLISLRLGLMAFLAGEALCGVNFIFYKHASIAAEYLHSYGMVLAFACVTYSSVEILDLRLPGIAARRAARWTLAFSAVAAFLPLATSPAPESYTTELFGFRYSYARFDFYQWYETRALPFFALALFVAAFLALRGQGRLIPRATKVFFSAGLGALGFSLFRLALASAFAHRLVWFEFWEEAAELMFTSAIALVLWRFRNAWLERTPILEMILEHQ
jgi:hypothetical protein